MMEPPKEVQQAPTLASVSEEGKEDGGDDGAHPMPDATPAEDELTISPEHMMLKHPLQVGKFISDLSRRAVAVTRWLF